MWRRENVKGAQECIEKQTERSDFWQESVRVQKLFLILDEHCQGEEIRELQGAEVALEMNSRS
jgi:hypothetical protein